MQQKKLTDYRPQYPKRLLKGVALTAAAVLVMSSAACTRVPDTNEETDLSGAVAIDEADPIVTSAPVDDETESVTRDGEPALMGKIVVPDDSEESGQP